MKKSLLVRLAIMFLVTLTLSGCILVPIDDGYHRGDSHGGGDRGGHKDHGGRH